jgi:hypothetical protein
MNTASQEIDKLVKALAFKPEVGQTSLEMCEKLQTKGGLFTFFFSFSFQVNETPPQKKKLNKIK